MQDLEQKLLLFMCCRLFDSLVYHVWISFQNTFQCVKQKTYFMKTNCIKIQLYTGTPWIWKRQYYLKSLSYHFLAVWSRWSYLTSWILHCIKFWIFKHRVNICEDTVHESTWGKKSSTWKEIKNYLLLLRTNKLQHSI